MTRRLLVALAVAGSAFATVPAAHAYFVCPRPTTSQWSGLYDPTTGERIYICAPVLPPQ
ncbi:MAG TPA: hypothetical protein VFQ85_13210 [Mycobacteriales bacterium]|jgi:hypothetical protein|nr:hypothetical protein [Mycobacteriales bacterium]